MFLKFSTYALTVPLFLWTFRDKNIHSVSYEGWCGWIFLQCFRDYLIYAPTRVGGRGRSRVIIGFRDPSLKSAPTPSPKIGPDPSPPPPLTLRRSSNGGPPRSHWAARRSSRSQHAFMWIGTRLETSGVKRFAVNRRPRNFHFFHEFQIFYQSVLPLTQKK